MSLRSISRALIEIGGYFFMHLVFGFKEVMKRHKMTIKTHSPMTNHSLLFKRSQLK